MPHRTTPSRRVVPSQSRVSFELADDVVHDLVPPSPTRPLEVQSEGDEAYAVWLERYPSALQKFEEIEQRLKGKRLAVFLDYDGTLTPIVKNPDKAFMSEDMRSTVREIARLWPTAIISGRGLEKVQKFVQLEDLFYAGSHGLDICAPKLDRRWEDGALQPAAKLRPLIHGIYDDLKAAVEHIDGAYVEDNKFCLSVHFRNCKEESLDEIKAIVNAVMTDHESMFKSTRGRKVLEIRPRMDWGKGKAVEHFLKAWGYAGDDVVPIYLGDDRTDEDAFRVLRERANGLGILVSSKAKPSDAVYSLCDPSEVLQFLRKLIEWGQLSNA